MARHEDIVNTIWDDLDHLSDDAFMLYVWSWTNTKCGMAGMYPVTRRTLIEGRFDEPRLAAALAELEADGKLFYVRGVLWNKTRVSHLSGFHTSKGLSGTICESIVKDLSVIDRANPLLARFVERYGDHPSLEGPLTPFRPPIEGLKSESQSQANRGSPGGLQTLPGQGQGQGQGLGREKENVPDHLLPILQELDHVAHDRSLSLKVEAAVRACEDYPDRDFDREAKRFRQRYIDGEGQNQRIRDVAGLWRKWLENAPPAGAGGPKVTKAPKKDRSAYSRVERAEATA